MCFFNNFVPFCKYVIVETVTHGGVRDDEGLNILHVDDWCDVEV